MSTGRPGASSPVCWNSQIPMRTSPATSPWVEGITDGVTDEVEGDHKGDEQYARNKEVRRHDAELEF